MRPLKVCLVGSSPSETLQSAKTQSLDRTSTDLLNSLFPNMFYNSSLGVQVDFIQYRNNNIVLWDIISKYSREEAISYTKEMHDGILMFHDKNDSSFMFAPNSQLPMVHV